MRREIEKRTCSNTLGRTLSLYNSSSTPSIWLRTCRFFPTYQDNSERCNFSITTCYALFHLLIDSDFRYYKITKFTSFLFMLLSHSTRSLQTRKPNRRPQLKIAKEYEWFTSTITPAWPKIMPSWFIFTSMVACKYSGAMHIQTLEQINYIDVEQTWYCIRTQSLFISVKFCSTKSTASMTVSASLQGYWNMNQIKQQEIHPRKSKCLLAYITYSLLLLIWCTYRSQRLIIILNLKPTRTGKEQKDVINSIYFHNQKSFSFLSDNVWYIFKSVVSSI